MTQVEAVEKFARSLAQNTVENLELRTNDFRLGDGFETSTNSVLSALLARQSALAVGLIESPPSWNGHIAPLILRSMIELLISVRWILIDPEQRSKEYISYGLGQEKLLTANYQKELEEGNADKRVELIVERNLDWIESQMFQMFVEVNLGSWTGMSVRKMCDEIGDPSLYKFSFAPFSACTHNSWNHVGKWNARLCENPMHKQHMVGFVADIWPIVDFVANACKYLELVIDAFDSHYGFNSELKKPRALFEEAVELFAEEWNSAASADEEE
ncbi:MAG: hypothetical protein HKN36_13530 [Hellea sp.]|nr:hypothetical protein [Hellea sp.]